MSRYDGLIIPRSYSEYINKTDAATLSAAIAQAMQLGGVSDAYPTANSTKIAQSGGIFKAAQILAADSTTITGATISAGSIVRVFFTAAITGSDASTALVLTYNGVDITVKVNKNGELSNFTAAGKNYTYLQSYTTLEMYYDGTNFVIIGNPVVISTTDYTIYTDGSKSYKKNYVDNKFKTKSILGESSTSISNALAQISSDDVQAAVVTAAASFIQNRSNNTGGTVLLSANGGDLFPMSWCKTSNSYWSFSVYRLKINETTWFIYGSYVYGAYAVRLEEI